MDQTAIAPQQAPASPPPAPPPAPTPGVTVRVPGPNGLLDLQVLSPEQVRQLRNAREELSSQLSSVVGRRNDLVDELAGLPDVARAGQEQRITQLDQRILQIERDIEATGRKLALAERTGGSSPPPLPPGRRGGFNVDGGAVAAMIVMFVGLSALRMVWNRGRPRIAPGNPAVEQRMERIEQAVDAIAIEVERIGEAQRYQAKLINAGPAQPIEVAERAAAVVARPA